ncbi:MAG: STAS domain-containing protein [Cyanobacteria bacterium P01_H01_bin.119]
MSHNVSVIEPSGILDGTKAAEFRSQINEALQTDADTLLVDLKDITFIDSSGLGALVVALKAVKSKERQMYICSVNEQIRMLFELTSMERVFEVFSDREAFETAIANR